MRENDNHGGNNALTPSATSSTTKGGIEPPCPVLLPAGCREDQHRPGQNVDQDDWRENSPPGAFPGDDSNHPKSTERVTGRRRNSKRPIDRGQEGFGDELSIADMISKVRWSSDIKGLTSRLADGSPPGEAQFARRACRRLPCSDRNREFCLPTNRLRKLPMTKRKY